MFKFADIRDTAVWKEAHEEGVEEGIEKGKELTQLEVVRNCQAKGMSIKAIADLLAMPLKDVRRVAKKSSK